ncbi:MAG: hypothetical protein ACLTW9_15600 [Enterocloster sp.]
MHRTALVGAYEPVILLYHLRALCQRAAPVVKSWANISGGALVTVHLQHHCILAGIGDSI